MTKAVFPDWSRGSRTPLGGSLPNQCFIICFKKGITFSVRKFRSIIYERCASVSLCTRTVAAFHFYDAYHHRKCRWRASHQWSGYIGDSVMIPSKFILPALHQLIISIRLQLITFFPNEWSADTFRMAKVIGWVGGKSCKRKLSKMIGHTSSRTPEPYFVFLCATAKPWSLSSSQGEGAIVVRCVDEHVRFGPGRVHRNLNTFFTPRKTTLWRCTWD